MIILINGAPGVGKTEVSRSLLACFDQAMMLDGGFICTAHPPEPMRDGIAEYRYRTLQHLISFHMESGFTRFVVNDTFATSQSIRRLRQLLADVDDEIHTFRLTCSEAALLRRWASLPPAEADQRMRRFRDVNEDQEQAARGADLGYRIDVSQLTWAQAADQVWQVLREEVALAPHNPLWWEAYDAERRRLQDALGAWAVGIHHVGSTAVRDLPAKPIVDIIVVVRKLDDALCCIAPLATLGYTFVDHPQNVDRRFFRKGFPRTHHLHVVEEGSRMLSDHLDFRDALRADPARRERYARIKSDLVTRYATDRTRYNSSKGAFIEDTLRDYRGQALHPLAE